MSRENCRNIEIKAKLANESDFNEKMNIAKEITGEKEPKILLQRDMFFNTLCGRLKLRHEEGTSAKLIQYDRSDIAGPKLSQYDILEVEDGNLLERMLSNSIGARGVLEKSRHLFMYGRTRIHLDVVKDRRTVFYGMEFEVKLEPEEDIEVGDEIARDLMEKFNLNKDQLLKESYFDILYQAK